MAAGVENGALSMEALSRLRRPQRPHALVLAPTRELARQILTVLKSVGHHCKISSELLVGGTGTGSTGSASPAVPWTCSWPPPGGW